MFSEKATIIKNSENHIVYNGKNYDNRVCRLLRDLMADANHLTADIVINNHIIPDAELSITENNGWVSAAVHKQFNFGELVTVGTLKIQIHQRGGDAILESTTTNVGIPLRPCDISVDFYVKIGSIFPFNELNCYIPESFFTILNSKNIPAKALDSYAEAVTEEPGDSGDDEPGSDEPGDDESTNSKPIKDSVISVMPLRPIPTPVTVSNSDTDGDYVDLGLPSGTLWRKTNLGATNVYDIGNYYAFGEPYYKNEYRIANYLQITDQTWDHTQLFDDEKKSDNQSIESWPTTSTHSWIADGNGSKMTLANFTSKGILDSDGYLKPEYDAATVALGTDRCMPDVAAINELFTQTDQSAVVYHNGNNEMLSIDEAFRESDEPYFGMDKLMPCLKFESKSDSSKYILIPCAGAINGCVANNQRWDPAGNTNEAVGVGICAKNGAVAGDDSSIETSVYKLQALALKAVNEDSNKSKGSDLYLSGQPNTVTKTHMEFSNGSVGCIIRPIYTGYKAAKAVDTAKDEAWRNKTSDEWVAFRALVETYNTAAAEWNTAHPDDLAELIDASLYAAS